MDVRDGRHRMRRGGGATAEERRLLTSVRRHEERRQQRDNMHRANRRQEPIQAPPPAGPAPAPAPTAAPRPGETRKDQLRRWQADREERRKVERARRAREPGVFRPAGAVRHKVAEFTHMAGSVRATAGSAQTATRPAQPTSTARPTQPAAHSRPAAARAAPQSAPAGRRVTRSMARPAAPALSRPSPGRGRAAAARGVRARAAPPRREMGTARSAAAAAVASVAPQAPAAARRGTRAAASPARAEPSRASRRAARRAEPAADQTRERGDADETSAEVETVTETAEMTETVAEMETEADAVTTQSATEMGAGMGRIEREADEMEQAEAAQSEVDEPGSQEKPEVQKPDSTEKRFRSPPRVSFAPEHHQFQAPKGVTGHVFRTPTQAALRPSFRKTPLLKRPVSSESGTDSDSASTPASCIASAIEEFRHLANSPWISMTRGSSSKKKRREDLERQRRLAAAIDMEDMMATDSDAATGTDSDSTPTRQGPSAAAPSPSLAAPADPLAAPEKAPEDPAPAPSVAVPKKAPTTPSTAPEKVPAASEKARAAAEKAPAAAEKAPAATKKTTSAPSPTAAACATSDPSGTSPDLSIPYFRRLLASETERLASLAGRWEAVAEAGDLPPEPLGEVRSVTGQARLLIRERFVQFDGLVDGAEFLRGPKPTTLTDLQGFWEMIYFQVEDVDRKFARLEQLQAAGWRDTAAPAARAAPAPAPAPARKPPAARRPAVKKAGPSAALRAAMMAARRKMKEETAEETAPEAAPASTAAAAAATSAAPAPATTAAAAALAPAAPAAAAKEERRFTGGFFTVETPTAPASAHDAAARHQRAELRRSLLLSGARPRRASDLSPLVRVSMSAKLAQTPSRLAASPPLPSREEGLERTPLGGKEEEKVPKRRASRAAARRPALSELSSNTPAAARPVRRSRRLPSLLGEPAGGDSPLPVPAGGDLMTFDSPAPSGGRRKSRRLTAASTAERAAC